MRRRRSGMAGTFATLNESWDSLPAQSVIDARLLDWGIWDATLSPQQRAERYVRFEGCDFGCAPTSEWPQLRRDLIEAGLEHALACRQDQVGWVPEFEFDAGIPEGVSVHMKPTPLGPEEAEWVERKMQEYVAMGLAERCSDAKSTCNIVLVRGG